MEPDDHRHLARRLDLFHQQDEAPGMVFWHPRGWCLYRLLEDAARGQLAAQGYREVRTPQVLRRPIWEASGHWRHFAEGMLHVEDPGVEAALKPVSCPGHVQILKQRVLSWRDLPLRLAEFGLVHRDEPSGTLHGLLRLREFASGRRYRSSTRGRAISVVPGRVVALLTSWPTDLVLRTTRASRASARRTTATCSAPTSTSWPRSSASRGRSVRSTGRSGST